MPDYDREHHRPPAPVAWVGLSDSSDTRRIDNIPMLLDTGADITVLPRSAVNELKLPLLDRKYLLEGITGIPDVADAVHARIFVAGLVFRGAFIVMDQPIGIIGRNVLNQIAVLFDGPSQRWDVSSGQPR